MTERINAVVSVFLVATALCGGYSSGGFPSLDSEYRAWLAANTISAKPVPATVVVADASLDGQPSAEISSLDAALFLRAVARHAPRLIVFASPVAADADAQLLSSVLQTNHTASGTIVFCGAARESIQLPRVRAGHTVHEASPGDFLVPDGYPAGTPSWGDSTVSSVLSRSGARAVASLPLAALLAFRHSDGEAITGSTPGWLRAGDILLTPVNTSGSIASNPLVEKLAQRMTLDELMLQTEKSEHGIISMALSAAFRDRVAILTTAPALNSVQSIVPAALNGLTDAMAPEWTLLLFGAALSGFLWLRPKRHSLFVGTAVALALWFLVAIAIYQQARLVLPAAGPVILAAVFVGISFKTG